MSERTEREEVKAPAPECVKREGNKEVRGIEIGDYVTDELDYMITGTVIAKGTITKLHIPTLKLERPDGKIIYATEDSAKLIVPKEANIEIYEKERHRSE